MNTYELKAKLICPVDTKVVDEYEVKVRSKKTIPVEVILNIVETIKKNGPILQEDFTKQLAERLEAKVTTYGVHSGVKTKVVCKA